MEPRERKNTADHLANERTFLAWIRTAIGIMAFGFVVVKFSLFLKQFSLLLGSKAVIAPKSHSAEIGIVLVCVGAIVSIFAFIKYKIVEQQINKNNFENSSLLIILLTCFILIISVLLIVYLLGSVQAYNIG